MLEMNRLMKRGLMINMMMIRRGTGRWCSARNRTVRSLSSLSGKYDFDKVIDRKNTNAIKYDRYMVNRDDKEKHYYPDILPMWVADMDFQAPDCITEAIIKRAQHKVFGYSGPDFKAKNAVLSYLRERQGLTFANAEDLIFLPGLVTGLNVIGRMAKRRNEAIMTMCPVYPPFLTCGRNMDTGSVAVPMAWSNKYNHYTFDFDAMEEAYKKSEQKVGIFLLCHPHNPLGRVWTKEELERLGKFCKKHGMVIVSDEIHCELILSKDAKHIPFLSLEEKSLRDMTIALHAPSKTFNLAGLCASFAFIPNNALRARMKRDMHGIVADIGPFGYLGLEVVYTDENGDCAQYHDQLIDYLRGNVEIFQSFIKTVDPLIQYRHEQQATYLAWLNCEELAKKFPSDVKTPFEWFEKHAGVGLNDGSFFGPGTMYQNYVRINLACPRSTVLEATKRISAAIDKL